MTLVALTTIDDSASFWEAARWQGACGYCGRTGGYWEAHHVVHKQHCRREGAALYSPDNALRVCAGGAGTCHSRHTSGQERICMCALRDENIAFAVRALGGPGPAYVYFNRYYGGSDPRVDALLEQL